MCHYSSWLQAVESRFNGNNTQEVTGVSSAIGNKGEKWADDINACFLVINVIYRVI